MILDRRRLHMTGMRQDVAAVVARIKAVYGRWGRDTSIEQMRADWDSLFKAQGNATVENATVESFEADGVPCQWIVVAPGARRDRSCGRPQLSRWRLQGGFPRSSHRELMASSSAASGRGSPGRCIQAGAGVPISSTAA
jgi:hypothetical protein